jgi:hypothetical protein
MPEVRLFLARRLSVFVFTNRKMVKHDSALILRFFPIYSKILENRKSSKIHNSTFHGQIRVGFELVEPENPFRRSETPKLCRNYEPISISAAAIPRDNQ